MPNFLSFLQRRCRRHVFAAVALMLIAASAAPACAFDLFRMSTVDVQFATQDGKPMADAEVKVYAPAEPNTVATTGRTDKDGKFSFEADRSGLWTAEARAGGEIARAMVRVGGPGEQSSILQSPYLLLGLLCVLLAIAIWYRHLRARARRTRGR